MNDPQFDRSRATNFDLSRGTLLVGLLLSVTCLYANVARNSYVGDFRAYYLASAAMLDRLDPYLNHAFLGTRYVDPLLLHTVHSRFIYPPSALIFFGPLAHLSFATSKTLFCSCMALLMVGVMAGLYRRFPQNEIVFLALFLSMPMFMNIENGQIDVLILALTLASFYLKDGPLPGLLLGLAIAIKVWPLLAVLWFLLNRRRRTVLFSAMTSGILALLAALHWGLRYWGEFLANVRSAADGGPLSNLPIPDAVQRAVDSNTLETTRDAVGHRPVFAIRQNPLQVTGHAQGVIGLVLVLAFLLWLERSRQGRKVSAEQRFFAFLAIALLANEALWATGLVALFPLIVALVHSSPRPNRATLLLVLPLLLPHQVIGDSNFLVWLFSAAFCMYENSWLGMRTNDATDVADAQRAGAEAPALLRP